MMHNRADYRLYLVTDRNCLQQQTLEKAVEQAILGGVTLVQLREKSIASKAFYEGALRIKAICHHYNVPLLFTGKFDIFLPQNCRNDCHAVNRVNKGDGFCQQLQRLRKIATALGLDSINSGIKIVM